MLFVVVPPVVVGAGELELLITELLPEDEVVSGLIFVVLSIFPDGVDDMDDSVSFGTSESTTPIGPLRSISDSGQVSSSG